MPLDSTQNKSKPKRGAVPKPKLEPKLSSAPKNTDARSVVIEPPKFEYAAITIRGVSPYVQHKFSEKSRKQMEARQAAGAQGNNRKNREPKDFNEVYERAKHVSTKGWLGMPAPAFRNAMISACRTAGFKMTLAKLSLFVEADGFDRDDGMPLVRIEGEPHKHEACARNASGVADVRWRPMWNEWSAKVRVRWDATQFSVSDVVNLMARAGMQVGVGEGRPDSPNSNGLGWGLWEVVA